MVDIRVCIFYEPTTNSRGIQGIIENHIIFLTFQIFLRMIDTFCKTHNISVRRCERKQEKFMFGYLVRIY